MTFKPAYKNSEIIVSYQSNDLTTAQNIPYPQMISRVVKLKNDNKVEILVGDKLQFAFSSLDEPDKLLDYSDVKVITKETEFDNKVLATFNLARPTKEIKEAILANKGSLQEQEQIKRILY